MENQNWSGIMAQNCSDSSSHNLWDTVSLLVRSVNLYIWKTTENKNVFVKSCQEQHTLAECFTDVHQ